MINGDGVAPNLFGMIKRLEAINNPADPGATPDFDDLVAAFTDSTDGLWATTPKEVGIVAGVDTFKLAAKAFRDIQAADLGAIAFTDYAAQHYGGFWTNKRMPAPDGTIQRTIVYRSSRKVDPLALGPLEKRACEIRFTSGRTLEGVALRYGDVADLGGGIRERFEPGAFSPVSDVVLNSSHDRTTPLARSGGGLTIDDGADALRIRAVLPETTAANDTLALVKANVMRGLSIEFKAIKERFEDGVRVVEQAALSAVAVVDTPAYGGSAVEARARKSRRTWIKGNIRFGVEAFCECLSGDCKKVLFYPIALERTDERDVLATVGRLSESLGSVFGGSLIFRGKPDRMDYEITDAARNSAAGKQIQDLVDARVPVYGRPLIDESLSVFKDVDGVREFTSAAVTALLFKPIADTAARDGWDPLIIDGKNTGFDRNRRSRLPWL